MNAEFECAQCSKNRRKKVAVKFGHAARFSGLILTLQSLSISDHCPNWLSKLRKPSPPGLRISATNPPSVGAAQRRLKYSPPPKKEALCGSMQTRRSPQFTKQADLCGCVGILNTDTANTPLICLLSSSKLSKGKQTQKFTNPESFARHL